uniref:Uncharacterized protein n=1 Tax=Oryza meridionalis TaxID=40149 RepID=A0A0E0FA09_9ORYZ
MGGAAPLLPSWRAVAAAWVALCLVPVVLSLAVLWLPLLCCAVAVVRFRRVRMMRSSATGGRRRCGGGGGRWPEKGEGEDSGGDRGMLLQKYLEDQMELVGEFAADPPPVES